jgi:hypothetical protein
MGQMAKILLSLERVPGKTENSLLRHEQGVHDQLKLRNIGITACGAMTSLYTADYRETGIPAATLFELIKGRPQ